MHLTFFEDLALVIIWEIPAQVRILQSANT
jgi:hypothetical protein